MKPRLGIAGLAVTMVPVMLWNAAGCQRVPERDLKRVTYVSTAKPDISTREFAAFQSELKRRLGNAPIDVEARLVVMAFGQAVPDVIADAHSSHPDVVIARANSLALESHRRAPEVPVVFSTIYDPVTTGLAESVTRPGRNMTGYSFQKAGDNKRWEVLADALPQVRTIGFVFKSKYQLPIARQTITVRGRPVVIVPVEWDVGDGFPALETAIRAHRIQALDFGLGVPFPPQFSTVTEWAAHRKMPTMFNARWQVDRGGLFGYETIEPEPAALFAGFTADILRGNAAGDLPVRFPSLFSMSVNLKTAETLGVQPSSSFLKRVDYWTRKPPSVP